MKLILLIVISYISFIYAAPFNDTKQIHILNQCGHTLQLGFQTNDEPRGEVMELKADGTRIISVRSNWAGRVWARESCDIHDCGLAGAGNPASLAEFRLGSVKYDMDYYDVSFVDGFNFPISIAPLDIKGFDELVKLDDKHCRVSACHSLPSCPLDLILNRSDVFVACESACSKYGTDDYCCTGKHNSAETCKSNHYAKEVKNMCPDSYSYAFDDATSVYGCKAMSYQVVFCP